MDGVPARARGRRRHDRARRAPHRRRRAGDPARPRRSAGSRSTPAHSMSSRRAPASVPRCCADVLGWAAGRIALDVELKEDGYAEQVAPMLDRLRARRRRAARHLVPRPAARTALPSCAPSAAARPADRVDRARARPERASAAALSVVLPEMRLVDEPLIAAGLRRGPRADRLGFHGRAATRRCSPIRGLPA